MNSPMSQYIITYYPCFYIISYIERKSRKGDHLRSFKMTENSIQGMDNQQCTLLGKLTFSQYPILFFNIIHKNRTNAKKKFV